MNTGEWGTGSIAIKAEGRFLGAVRGTGPMSEANARLIAAAPDLLAACRLAIPELTAWSNSGGFTDVHGGTDEYSKALRAIWDALQKATGTDGT